MTQLNNHQLKLLTELNGIRLSITQQFKSKESPDPGGFLQDLLKLEVLLMENKNKEHVGELLT